MIVTTVFIPTLFLIGASILTAVRTALREQKATPLLLKLEPLREFLALGSVMALVGYGASGVLFIAHEEVSFYLFGALALLLLIALAIHFLFHLFATHAAIATLKLFSIPASLYLILLFPFVYPFLLLEKWFQPKIAPVSFKDRLEALSEETPDPVDKKFISSLAQFGDLVAREIMIPRPDMLCLPETTTLEKALHLFAKEGYSRIPLYRDSIDDITSVLLYKSAMEQFLRQIDPKTPVSQLSNEILYAPENKKIRDLFQEMRLKKIHVAIVVNEYGCTEGLLTIEDILEELVGSEIQDEHDLGEESLYKKSLDKGWIVDATMSIVDVEKELNLELPHGPEYETVAGFLSLQAGCIPKPGTIVHGENFHIEVLKSDERQILEVKITPE